MRPPETANVPPGDGVPAEGAGARSLLHHAATRLAAAGIADPRREAEWLLEASAGVARYRLLLAGDEAVDTTARRRFVACVERRLAREPLQYILGMQPFRTVDLAVDGRVLIPRPETEQLVDFCLALHHDGAILDVGTGSGAIAIALAVERPGLRVVATDVSVAALRLARSNAARVGVDVAFVCGDLLAPVAPLVAGGALVVCNPPYIASRDLDSLEPEVREWEPRLALDGGADGLSYYRRLAIEGRELIAAGAWLVVEVGAQQRRAVEACMTESGAFASPVVGRDHAGIERMLGFRRRAARGRRRGG